MEYPLDNMNLNPIGDRKFLFDGWEEEVLAEMFMLDDVIVFLFLFR